MKTINTTLFKLTEFDYTLDELGKFITGTSKIATLHGATYDDIVRHFGEPSIYYNTMKDGKKLDGCEHLKMWRGVAVHVVLKIGSYTFLLVKI